MLHMVFAGEIKRVPLFKVCLKELGMYLRAEKVLLLSYTTKHGYIRKVSRKCISSSPLPQPNYLGLALAPLAQGEYLVDDPMCLAHELLGAEF